MYLGDIALGATIDFKFTTRAFASGAPTTLSGTPAISAYPGNSTTQLTAGITLSVDFDAVTGLNNVRVVATSGNGYATATDYALVITTGTVGGVSVVGETVGHFSIEARSALRPTTAGRTLVVDAAGLADANMVKAGPTGSGTAQTARDIGGAVPAAVAGAAGGLMISGSNAGTTTFGALTVTGATTLTGAVSATSGSNDVRLGATERGSIRDKVQERTALRGTVGAASSTTSVVTSAMSPATSVADQVKGQILMFDFDTTTAALRGQKTDITASTASATPTLTVTALTTAPVSGDTFTIG